MPQLHILHTQFLIFNLKFLIVYSLGSVAKIVRTFSRFATAMTRTTWSNGTPVSAAIVTEGADLSCECVNAFLKTASNCVGSISWSLTVMRPFFSILTVVLMAAFVRCPDSGNLNGKNLTSVEVNMKNMSNMKMMSVIELIFTSPMCFLFLRKAMIK